MCAPMCLKLLVMCAMLCSKLHVACAIFCLKLHVMCAMLCVILHAVLYQCLDLSIPVTVVISFSIRVCKQMDCHDNHRYHPYAPPADSRHERYLGRDWFRRDHYPFPSGRGARNGRYMSGRRGTGTPSRSLEREDMYHPPLNHEPVRHREGHLDSRYERLQRTPSPQWYQGRSMHYGPPRPPTNYYFERERNLRWPSGNNRVHYRAAGYSPHPRLYPKSMRPASSHPTGLVLIM